VGSPRLKLASMYAISRLKRAKTAWQWRVHFRRRGKLHAKSFPDLTYGSTRKALAAAIVWRDRWLGKLRPLRLREFNAMRRSNNTSGVAGVHFLKSRRQPLGYWQAKVKLPEGRKIHRSFSVRRFGNPQALKLAFAARAELLMQVENRPYLHNRIAKQFVAK
jgi:hypothetical protein